MGEFLLENIGKIFLRPVGIVDLVLFHQVLDFLVHYGLEVDFFFLLWFFLGVGLGENLKD